MRLNLCMLALAAAAQIALAGWCVTAQPQPLKASAMSLGTARDFGLWEIAITREGADTQVVSREQLVERIPFAFLKEFQARDVLSRKADTSRWSIAGKVLQQTAAIAPAAVGVAGMVTKNNKVQAAGYVLLGIQFLVQRAQHRAPDPAETEKALFPDAGAILGPQGWDGLVVSGLVHSATKIGPLCTAESLGLDQIERDPVLAAWRLVKIMEARRANGLI